MQIIWTFGLLYGSQNMIQAHAYTLNNVHGLFIVVINTVLGVTPVKEEMIGISVSIVGCILMITDPSAHRNDGVSGSFVTYTVCLASAIFGAFYFMMNAKNVKSLPICFLLLIMNIHNFILCSALAIAVSQGEIKFFSLDPVNGCFGFLNQETALMAFVPYGIFCAFLGSAGYVICLLFYSPVVTSNAYLLEPFIA